MPNDDHFIWKALGALKEKDIIIVFRLHPGYKNVKENLEKKLKSIDFDDYIIDKNEDVYDSLDSCLLHITQFSSSTLDALLLGKKTLLIDPRGQEYFSEFSEFGNQIKYISNLTEFTKQIYLVNRE